MPDAGSTFNQFVFVASGEGGGDILWPSRLVEVSEVMDQCNGCASGLLMVKVCSVGLLPPSVAVNENTGGITTGTAAALLVDGSTDILTEIATGRPALEAMVIVPE